MVNIRATGWPAVEAACLEALREGVHSADVVINILARYREPAPPITIMAPDALRLRHAPAAPRPSARRCVAATSVPMPWLFITSSTIEHVTPQLRLCGFQHSQYQRDYHIDLLGFGERTTAGGRVPQSVGGLVHALADAIADRIGVGRDHLNHRPVTSAHQLDRRPDFHLGEHQFDECRSRIGQ
jgi:hypothetical protein